MGMRSPTLYVALLFGLLGLVWTYQAFYQPALRGHWHLVSGDPSGPGGIPFRTLDIDAAGSVTVNDALGKSDWFGYLEAPSRVIRFGGECLAAEFTIRRWGNRIYLDETGFGPHDRNPLSFTFERHEVGTCDRTKEFAARFPVPINLPYRRNGVDDSFSLSQAVEMLALPASNTIAGLRLVKPDSPIVYDTVDWGFEFEMARLQLPPHMREGVVPVVYADPSISDTRLEITLHQLREFQCIDHFYRAVISENERGEAIIGYRYCRIREYLLRSCVLYG